MIRFFFVVLAFCMAFAAHAAKLPDMKQMGINNTGKVATMGPTGQGTFYGQVGAVAPPANMSGWTPAGNFGAAISATGPTMTMSGQGNVFMAGVKYPFQAGYVVPVSTLVDGLIAMSGGPLGVAIFAAPFVAEWLTASGGRVNPATGQIERTDSTVCTVAPCFDWQVPMSNPKTYQPTQQKAVDIFATTLGPSCFYTLVGQWGAANGGAYAYFDAHQCPNSSGTYVYQNHQISPSASAWLPSSMDDIAPYMAKTAPDPRVVQSLLDKGVDFTMPNPAITGPASVDGPETTTNNPDGSKTVSKTTYNFKTEGNTVTNTDNRSTVTVVNVDNSIRSSSSTMAAPAEKDTSTPADTALPAAPKLYTPKYPNGMTGVWTAKKAVLMASPMLSLIPDLMPRLGSSAGYPSFPVPVVIGPWNFGTYDVSPASYVWDFIKFCVLVTTAFFVRAVIFGG